MQDEEKKTRKPRRSKEEIAADYQRRAMRIRHSGARDAIDILEKVSEMIEEAAGAAEGIGPDLATKAVQAVDAFRVKVHESIPPEAR